MIKQFDVVALTESLTADHLPEGTVASMFEVPSLPAGTRGTVVEVYQNGAGYEVEFVNEAGYTLALVTLLPGQVQPVSLTEAHRHAA